MRYGFDAAYVPDDGTLSSWRRLGYDFFFGYHGGRALRVWTPDDWRRVNAQGYALGSYWVAPSSDAGMQRGVDDGNASLVALQALGLSGIALLDIENGVVEDDYIAGFHAATTAGSCALGVYGSATTLHPAFQLGLDFYTVLAAWPLFSSAVRRAPPDFHVWQYGGTSAVDYNVAADGMLFATLSQP